MNTLVNEVLTINKIYKMTAKFDFLQVVSSRVFSEFICKFCLSFASTFMFDEDPCSAFL